MRSLSVLKTAVIGEHGEGCSNCGKHIKPGRKAYYVIDRETWNDASGMQDILLNGWFESVHCSSACAHEECSTL